MPFRRTLFTHQRHINQIKNHFLNKDYETAQRVIENWEKQTESLAERLPLWRELHAIIQKDVNPLQTYNQVINTKGLARFIKARAHEEIVRLCVNHFEQHSSHPDGYSVQRVDVHYNIAINLDPYLHFGDDMNLSLGKQFQRLEQYKKALFYYEQISTQNNTYDWIITLLAIGDCYHELNNEKKAVETFSKAVEIYQKKLAAVDKLNTYMRTEIASAAFYCAEALEQPSPDSGLVESDSQAGYFYRFAAKLNHAASLYALGYRYANGIGVEINLTSAIESYEKAAAKGHRDSIIALFRLLRTHHLNCSQLVQQMAAIENDLKIYHLLGTYYYSKAQKLSEKALNKTNPFYSRAHRLAYENYLAAANLGSAAAMFNIGVMFEYGYGFPIDLVKAEKFYLDAADRKYKKAYVNLAALYQRKLSQHEAEPLDDQHLKKISGSMLSQLAKTDLAIQVDTSNLQELVTALSAIKLEVKNQCVAINNDILRTFRNPSLKLHTKCETIMEYDLHRINFVNVVTIIHKMGNLFEKIHDASIFNYLPKIISLLPIIRSNLAIHAFSLLQLTLLIEGISKFYLQKEASLIYICLKELLAAVMQDIDQVDLRGKITILFAITRLDFESDLPLATIVAALQDSILVSNEHCPLHDAANVLYAAALIDCRYQFMRCDFITFFLKKMLDFDLPDCPTTQASQRPVAQQSYLALLYFSKKLEDIDKSLIEEKLAQLNTYLAAVPEKTRDSYLQNDVLSYLTPYFCAYEFEKIIDSLPVDAFFTMEAQSFILQVDGPAHFLHAEERDPQPSLKLWFRNTIHHYRHPLVTINYHEWNAIKDRSETSYTALLAAKLSVLDIKLEKKWQVVTKKTSPGFFATKSTARPVIDTFSSLKPSC